MNMEKKENKKRRVVLNFEAKKIEIEMKKKLMLIIESFYFCREKLEKN